MKTRFVVLLPSIATAFVVPPGNDGSLLSRSSSVPRPTSSSRIASTSSQPARQETGRTYTSAEEQHAREVFSIIDADNSRDINQEELSDLLAMLDIDADDEECKALFRYLDVGESGKVGIDEFLPWYSDAVDSAKSSAQSFQSVICNRRTVDHFDRTPIADDVLERAIQCAISAPNRSGSEPWRFVRLGPSTVEKISDLNKRLGSGEESSFVQWKHVPGWCVVTCRLSDNGSNQPDPEDYKSVSCAIQNFMLSMWSEGVGSKWTSGPVQKTPEFAELCGVDMTVERVVGVVWYGFARGGLQGAEPKQRRKSVADVLTRLP